MHIIHLRCNNDSIGSNRRLISAKKRNLRTIFNFRLVKYFFVLIIDCLILYTFLLLSNKAEEEKMALIKKSMKNSNDAEGRFIIEEDDEDERLRFKRKNEEYRRLADE